mmetsp:Transcript_6000/g.24330  ORF Transcript_6000/g.24330 Transcript_6000/m.24330 type:complete len:390 (+) Transcript_6000:49-1218(+)
MLYVRIGRTPLKTERRIFRARRRAERLLFRLFGCRAVLDAQPLLEVAHHHLEPLREGHLGLPVEQRLGLGDVRPPPPGVVRGVFLEHGGRGRVHHLLHLVRELQHGELAGVADVDGAGVLGVHQRHQAFHQVGDVLERPSLGPVAVDGHGCALDGLLHEVAHHAAVVQRHARTVRVEDARDANLQPVFSVVVKRERLRAPLAFVVARSFADGVDVAPVLLGLRVLKRVAVHLGSAGQQETRLDALRQAEHVQRADHVGLDRLHRIELVVHGRGGARQVVHLVALQQDGLHDIVSDDLEVGLADVVLDVLLGAGEEVVQAHHVIAAGHQEVDQVRPDEAGAARHQHAVDAAHAGAGLGLDQGVAVFVHRARWGESHERAGVCGAEKDSPT